MTAADFTFAREVNQSFRDGVQIFWDSTSVGLAETCPRKYYYSMIVGLQGRTPSPHLRFGGLFATAAENYYKRRFAGMSHDLSLLACVRDAMIETWDDENGQPEIFLDDKKTRPNLIRTIVWYLDQYSMEREADAGINVIQLKNGEPAVELSFKLQFDSDLYYCGHLDRAVEYGGANFIMDQKTTGGTINARFFNQFKPNTQMSGYSYAGKVILQTPVSGVLIDGVQIAINQTSFQRGFTMRTEEELDEWYSSMTYHVRMMQHFSAAGDERDFPMNTASCGNYGGCPFHSLCSSPPNLRSRLFTTEYRPKVWDPSISR